MRQRSGRRLFTGQGQAGGAPPGDNNPMRARALASANNGPKVVGIGHLIQHHHQRLLAPFAGIGKNFFNARIGPRRAESQQALMGRINLVEPVALHKLHHHARFPGHAHDIARRAGKVALGHQQLFPAARRF